MGEVHLRLVKHDLNRLAVALNVQEHKVLRCLSFSDYSASGVYVNVLTLFDVCNSLVQLLYFGNRVRQSEVGSDRGEVPCEMFGKHYNNLRL